VRIGAQSKARRRDFVRVHETGKDGSSVAFNLDSFAQFERYAGCVEGSNRKSHYRYPDTDVRTPQRWVNVSLFPRDYTSHSAIHISAEREEAHGPCKFCEAYFDSTAGNATGAR